MSVPNPAHFSLAHAMVHDGRKDRRKPLHNGERKQEKVLVDLACYRTVDRTKIKTKSMNETNTHTPLVFYGFAFGGS